jgi:hypothetical protein
MRARGLKPGLFKNEALAEITPPWGRLLFMGLWGLADREGRLIDRPGHIAVEVLPYDLTNGRLTVPAVDKMLAELAHGADPFIFRYVVDGLRLIQIVNFRKHQSPHHTEKASELPEYQGVRKNKRSKKLTVDPPKSNGEPIVNPPKGNGGNPPDSGLLTPDSGQRTPDRGHTASGVSVSAPPVTLEDLARLWNEMAPPELKKADIPFMRPQRDAAEMMDVIQRHADKSWWTRVFDEVHRSPYLRGRNEKRWKAGIDFVLKNAETILDGKYHEGRGPLSTAERILQNFARRSPDPIVVNPILEEEDEV